MTDKVEIKPCPFCGAEINRVESWAQAFKPAKLFHEYHHPGGQKCIFREMLWAGEAESASETRFLALWNTRTTAEQGKAELLEALDQADQLLVRYRHETPLGHQPHMIAHIVDKWKVRARALIAKHKEAGK